LLASTDEFGMQQNLRSLAVQSVVESVAAVASAVAVVEQLVAAAVVAKVVLLPVAVPELKFAPELKPVTVNFD